ncbi:xylulokinase [Microlunatus sagamiharensis]|uniref:Xylulose kinase n=1 Tax=Microlunatus sagamiharensis TaxID=546874 RepID=A0A1H2MKR3_9ACTN|nr:xylulokinase [Microlunatus sagamiharensis]SDU93823.1 xylulokinase [Microlunatus sagamiharensis]
MTGHWLGVDLGTSGVKVVAVDDAGDVAATHTCSYPLQTPRPGWTEQHPQDWWEGTLEAVRTVVAALDAADGTVTGVGLSGQMHGMVALDRHGEVLRPAILWNDNRNAAECELQVERVGGLDALVGLTNNAALPGYTLGKILWLRRHEPEVFARTEVVLNPKDFLRLRLTGERATDVSDASGFGALDVRRRRWSDDLLTALELPGSLLPPVLESDAPAGRITAEAAALTGLPAGTPVVAGGGDSVLQTTSMGIVAPGTLGITLGTAGILGAALERCPDNVGGRLQISCGNEAGRWHVMGVALSTGGALQWWAKALRALVPDADAATVTELAGRSPVGSRGVRFLPYLVGERAPHVDPDARAGFVGLDLSHDLTDLSRAVLEGALLNLREIRDVMAAAGVATDDVRISGGASAYPVWRQTLADVLGTEVHLVTGGEQGAAYGAALLAGVGGGRWSSLSEALGHVVVTDRVSPDPASVAVHDVGYDEFRRIYPALTTTRTP